MQGTTATELASQFRTRFGTGARIFRAPGRVNLIGEHTDYNDGFVMPAAIDFSVWVAIAPSAEPALIVHSINFSETVEIQLQYQSTPKQQHWSDYIRGVAMMLENSGHKLQGANMMIKGEVPIGAGLSSSAAIEVASAVALLANTGKEIERIELAKLCHRAESEFVGVRVGIMDPFVSCCARAGRALMLDCRTLDFRLLRVPDDVALVICNTMVKHELGSSEYNARRAQCEEGVRILSRSLPAVRALRDVSPEQLDEYRSQLPEVVYRRCRHVISENARVEQAAAALQSHDLREFGRLMAESHASLRDDYEVSCAELDLMVELANQEDGVYGSRMTGGGFGGCTINIIQKDAVAEFKSNVSQSYQRKTNIAPEIFVSSAAEGAGEVLP